MSTYFVCSRQVLINVFIAYYDDAWQNHEMVETRRTGALAQLATIFTGVNPARVATSEAAPRFPMVSTKDVGVELTARSDLDEIALENASSAQRYGLAAGDVVVTARGVAVRAAVAEAQHDGVVLGGNLIALRPNPTLNSYLLAAWLQHPRTQRRLLEARTGVGTPGFTVAQLARLTLAVPTPDDQHDLAQLASLASRQQQAVLRAAELRRRFVDDLVFDALDPSGGAR